MVLEGIRASKISKGLGYDKAYISRIINRLVTGGYLICINPQSREKFYEATKKPFLLRDIKQLTKLTPVKSQRLRHRRNIIKIQKSTFKTKIKSKPKLPLDGWEDKPPLKNGVKVQQFFWPFPNVGNVTFRRLISDNVDRLIIILPQFLWERDNGNPEQFLRETAARCGTWLMHRFKMELEGLERCQKPHHAMPLTDPRLIHMAQNGSYNNGVLMVDSSAPDNTPEIESENYDIIDGLTTVVPRVNKLEKEVGEIKSMIVDFRAEFNSVFSQPARPDERRDVV